MPVQVSKFENFTRRFLEFDHLLVEEHGAIVDQLEAVRVRAVVADGWLLDSAKNINFVLFRFSLK